MFQVLGFMGVDVHHISGDLFLCLGHPSRSSMPVGASSI